MNSRGLGRRRQQTCPDLMYVYFEAVIRTEKTAGEADTPACKIQREQDAIVTVVGGGGEDSNGDMQNFSFSGMFPNLLTDCCKLIYIQKTLAIKTIKK
jgi:hypothetical protein